jgi:hypothetical protein
MKKQTDQEFTHVFGKMVKGKNSLLLEKDELSDTQNMQPGFGWKQRRGMSELTASAVATGLRFKSLVQFRDLAGDSDAILAHTYDSVNGERVMIGSALPPSSITWSEMYDLTASCEISQWANLAEAVLLANNKDFLIWRGNSYTPSGVFFYDGGNDKYINFYDELTDEDPDTGLDLSGYDASADDAVYVISEQQLEKITPNMATVNAVKGVLIIRYWNGTEFVQINSATTGGTFADGTRDPDETDGDEFTGTEIDEDKWNLPAGSGSANSFQDDGYAYNMVGNGDSTLSGAGKTILSGDFRVMMLLDCGTEVGTGQDANSMRLYVKSVITGNTLCYIGRFGRTANTQHLCDIKVGGSSQDEQWDIVGTTEDLICYYMIERIGVALTSYWSTDAKNWTLLSQDNTWVADDVYVYVFNRILDYQTWTGNPTIKWIRVGTPLAQTGDITWTPPADEAQTFLQGIPGYVYQLVWTNDINGVVEKLDVGSLMGPVEDIWDGMPRTCTGCYVYDGSIFTDYTAYVNNFVEGQSADLSGATTSYALYVGFGERVTAIDLYIPSESPNAAASVIDAIYYYDTTGMPASVGAFTDTTKVDTESFAQKGRISWADPGRANEKMTTIGGDTTPMYWYRIEWSGTLSDPMGVYYIAGVPTPDNPVSCYGCFAYKRRAWQLAPIGDENSVRFSASNLPNVWNGMDSGSVYFGERPLRAAAPFYNETVIYADTEMWMLQGNAPMNFGRLRLSATVGISAVQSLVSVESGVNVNDSIKVLLTWQFNDGFWLFDGVRIWKISAPDIDSFFDPDHDDYINPTYLDQTSGAYDFTNQLVMWSVYSGSTATTPTKVIVLHVPSMWYGIFDYGTDIGTILSVINNKMYMVAGGFDNGKFYLLDTGKTDVDTSGTVTAVDAFVTTADMKVGWGEGIRQRLFSLWAESDSDGGLIEVDEYPDGLETPVPVGEQSMTWLGKIFGAFQKNLKVYPGQKTSKFRIRNRSKNARMKLIGHSTTVDRGRSNE